MDVVNLAEKFSRFPDAWSPKIVGEINEMHVKVVKLRGEFVCTTTTPRTSCSSWWADGYECSCVTATATSAPASSSSCRVA